MRAEIEKRAEELGVAQEVYKSASILEGLALYGFHDELSKIAQKDDKEIKEKKEDKKDDEGKKKKKNGGKEDEAKGKGGEKEEKEEKNMSKKERFFAMIKKKKEGKDKNKKSEKKEMKKESSFSSGFKDGFEKTASLGSVVKKIGPYVLGGTALGTAGYALHKQKKETAATRTAVGALAAGTGRAVKGVSMRQRWNDMRDQINEQRLARGVNVNRQAILNLMKSKTSGK